MSPASISGGGVGDGVGFRRGGGGGSPREGAIRSTPCFCGAGVGLVVCPAGDAGTVGVGVGEAWAFRGRDSPP